MASTDLVAFKALLPPVLLSTENVVRYNELSEQLVRELKTARRDVLEFLLVDQVLQETWKILRYHRHQTLGIERRFEVRLELQKPGQGEQATKQPPTSPRSTVEFERPEGELSQLKNLADVIETTAEDLGALIVQKEINQREFMQNRALRGRA